MPGFHFYLWFVKLYVSSNRITSYIPLSKPLLEIEIHNIAHSFIHHDVKMRIHDLDEFTGYNDDVNPSHLKVFRLPTSICSKLYA